MCASDTAEAGPLPTPPPPAQNDQEWKNWGALMRETKHHILGGKPADNIVTFTM